MAGDKRPITGGVLKRHKLARKRGAWVVAQRNLGRCLMYVRAEVRVAWKGEDHETALKAIRSGEPWSEHEERKRAGRKEFERATLAEEEKRILQDMKGKGAKQCSSNSQRSEPDCQGS